MSGVLAALRTSGPEPSYPTLPITSPDGETSVAGLYVVGEVAGTPLLKLGLNAGVDLVDRLAPALKREVAAASTADILPLVVVGAGAAGLSAAMRAHSLGLSSRVLEANELAQTVVKMVAGKKLLAEPLPIPNRSELWFEECTREDLLARWRAQVADAGLDVREHERVTNITRDGDIFTITSNKGTHRARRVILAIGKSGAPRKLDVPGEEAWPDKVHHQLPDHLHGTTPYDGKDVLIVGGGDVACEAAIALAARGRVTMVVRKDLSAARKTNADAVMKLAQQGRLTLHLGAAVSAFDRTTATLQTASGPQTVANDHVFELIGTDLPLGFLRAIGVRLQGEWHPRKYLVALAVFVGVYTLYALKKYPDAPYAWPFHLLLDEARFRSVVGAAFQVAFLPFSWAFTDDANREMRATLWFQQGYLYSLAYTLIMAGFGWQALVRWTAKAKDPRYQRLRYASLIAFQVVFFLAANVVAVQALSLQHAWRAWGLYQPWPLFFNTFAWWNTSDPMAVKVLFIGGGLLGTFVAIPLLARNHGKRFCTWVCGCGGLAETLGDRWRDLAPKGSRSRAWEFQGFVVLLAAAVVTIISVGAYGTRADNSWALAYAYIVDFWLVAVIPIALYPFFGGKIWCRYWCPLAAWNQLLSRVYGRLEIRANDACITCGECSKFCQVGVDVMAFARKEASFDNRNSSCIHCGICIDVCPMDVLSFGLSDAAPKVAKGRGLPIVQ